MVQLQQWLGPCQLVHLPRAPSHCSGIGQCLGVGLAGTLLTATPPWAPRSLAHTDFCYSPAMRLDPGTMSVLTQTASAPRRKSCLKAVRRWVAQYLKKLYCTFSKAKRRTSLVIEMSNNWSATGWALPCTGRCGIMLILKEFSFFFSSACCSFAFAFSFSPCSSLNHCKNRSRGLGWNEGEMNGILLSFVFSFQMTIRKNKPFLLPKKKESQDLSSYSKEDGKWESEFLVKKN